MRVPASDAIDGRLGDGVEVILSLRIAPVVLVFTKLMCSPPKLSSTWPLAMHKIVSPPKLFHKDLGDVLAAIVSEHLRCIDLIDILVITTDRSITDLRPPSTPVCVYGIHQRVGAVPLACSAALRVNHDIIILTSVLFLRVHF